MLTADQFSSPWAYLDAKQRAFTRDRTRAEAELELLGWKIRDNHPVNGVWRAQRRSKDGTVRMSATTAAELVRLCQANFDKPALKAAKEKAREEKRKAREQARAAKKAAKEAKRREA